MLAIEKGWAFVPGPPAIDHPPLDSTGRYDIALYPPEAIARAILDCSGFVLLHDANPTWWQWSAAWERNEMFMILDMTLIDEPVAWGGSNIVGYCEPNELIALWDTLRRAFPALWILNDNCELHTPESFQRRISARSDEYG